MICVRSLRRSNAWSARAFKIAWMANLVTSNSHRTANHLNSHQGNSLRIKRISSRNRVNKANKGSRVSDSRRVIKVREALHGKANRDSKDKQGKRVKPARAT